MAAVLALAILVALGNNWLQTTTLEVESVRLPSSFDGYCIVQISDLHGHRFGRNQSRLVAAVREANPDLIVITGDVTWMGRWEGGYVDELARQLHQIAPTCLVTGNHDHLSRDLPKLLNRLEGNGIKVLNGASMNIARGSESIVVAGIQDPGAFRHGTVKREMIPEWKSVLEVLRGALGEDRFKLLLSHRPELIAQYQSLGFDLVLAGHAHGGQVRLPGIGALYAPDQGFFPQLTSGIHRRGETTLVVSRGLGGSKLPIRVFNRPELVIVRLRRAGA